MEELYNYQKGEYTEMNSVKGFVHTLPPKTWFEYVLG